MRACSQLSCKYLPESRLQNASRHDITATGTPPPPTARLAPQPTANGQQQQQPCVFVHQQALAETQPSRERLSNFGELSKTTPPFKDYMNNLHTYQYLQQIENADLMQSRHNQITQQYSSSTDEGCDTDHGGDDLMLLNVK
jgi:hypothetical protein